MVRSTTRVAGDGRHGALPSMRASVSGPSDSARTRPGGSWTRSEAPGASRDRRPAGRAARARRPGGAGSPCGPRGRSPASTVARQHSRRAGASAGRSSTSFGRTKRSARRAGVDPGSAGTVTWPPPTSDPHAVRRDRLDHALEEARKPDELGDEPGRGPRVDVLRRAELLDPAAVHDGDPIGQGQRLLLVVRHVHRRDAQARDARPGSRSASPRGAWRPRFESGSSRSSTFGRYTSARASPTRCCCPPDSWRGCLSAWPSQPDELDASATRLARSAAETPRIISGNADVVPDRHVREQREVLEHHAELAPVGRQIRHVPAVDHDAARVRPHVAGERPERRRLARSPDGPRVSGARPRRTIRSSRSFARTGP